MYISTASTYTYLHLLERLNRQHLCAHCSAAASRSFSSAKKLHFGCQNWKTETPFLCKHPPKWWITYLFYAFNTSGWVLSQLFKNWLIWSLFLLLKWRTWLGCGVTGWTNFKVIFLFLLLTIHDLTSIGPVAGGSDNFLIFWAALLPHPIVNEGAQSNA